MEKKMENSERENLNSINNGLFWLILAMITLIGNFEVSNNLIFVLICIAIANIWVAKLK